VLLTRPHYRGRVFVCVDPERKGMEKIMNIDEQV